MNELGKKKNENAEAAMKEEREKAQLKNKEPKEEFVDLGKPKNKTAKNLQKDGKPSGIKELSFEDARGQSSSKKDLERVAGDIHREEPTDEKSKR